LASGRLIVTSGGTGFHRDVIIPLAARLRLPAVYPYRYYAADGGLMSYWPNTIDQYRRAAGYVDRILKGEKPAEMLQFFTNSSPFSDDGLGCRTFTIGLSSSLDKIRAAAPSRSSYWPLFNDHKKAASPTAPKANAIGMR
jgi:hypothetical protein